ncbi:MAG: glycosyltransferase family 2 protein [Bacteroidia bacterium]
MLSIIICTYKRPELLKKCVSCCLKIIDAIESELIVVNDDNTASVSVISHPKICLLNNPKTGLASARNFGAKNAKGDLLLFIDDDIEFETETVLTMLNHYNKNGASYNPNWKYSDEMLSIVKGTQFGRFLIANNLISYRGWVRDLNWQNEIFEVSKLAGFFFLINKNDFFSINGFNEEFENQGTEDDELCRRLKAKGIKMYIDPTIYVNHNELDRISLENRLVRYSNGAENRRKAFELGLKEYEIPYSALRRFVLTIILPFRYLLVLITKLIPNKIQFDSLYFKFCRLLIAIYIFKGYRKSK